MPQIRKFNMRYLLRSPVANMAEAVNCICHYCGQQGHKKPDCPIRRSELEAKGLNLDEINEHNRQKSLANRAENGGGRGCGGNSGGGYGAGGGNNGVMEAVEDTKDAAAMAMVGEEITFDQYIEIVLHSQK